MEGNGYLLGIDAERDVPAGEELTYNYGYIKDSVEGKQMIGCGRRLRGADVLNVKCPTSRAEAKQETRRRKGERTRDLGKEERE